VRDLKRAFAGGGTVHQALRRASAGGRTKSGSDSYRSAEAARFEYVASTMRGAGRSVAYFSSPTAR
jgi:hypothetical protein